MVVLATFNILVFMKEKAHHKIARAAVSRMRRDVMRKKLKDALSRANDEHFLQMIWAVDAIQSGREKEGLPYLRQVPKEAITTEVQNKYLAHKWFLETLIAELLTTSKIPEKPGREFRLDCMKYTAFAMVYNFLHELEGAEYGVRGASENIFMEMHRIGQRQFPWQRGYVSPEVIYRYHFIYGQGACATYFEQIYGLTVNEFSMLSVALYLEFGLHPWAVKPRNGDLNVTPETVDAALNMLTVSLPDARKMGLKLRNEVFLKGKGVLRTAYQPSVLRHFPIIFSKNIGRGSYCAPLPDLIMYRATAGLYFYLRSGPQALFDEANARFELYAQRLIAAHCPRFEVLPNVEYRFNRSPAFTPDVLLKDAGNIVAVFECKATKLTFDAQFSDDPVAQAKGAYDQISKGIFQLWKFFSHARRGLIGGITVSPIARGIVLTLEPWLQMSSELQAKAIEMATALAAGDAEITAADMRPVSFCTIHDLEETLTISDEDELLAAFDEAALPQYAGWAFTDARKRAGAVVRDRKPYPFDLGEVLPWWKKLNG